LFDVGKEQAADILVQGGVAIAAGVMFFTALFLPWLTTEYTAISGMTHAENQAQLVIPLTLILLAVLTIFGGSIHILGYRMGIHLATVTSAIAFFISVMVIIVTLASANNSPGNTLNLLIGPWICAAGSIFGAISSKLERKIA
jgi:predicted neutral ceramidase superfamily lipid hydrolase